VPGAAGQSRAAALQPAQGGHGGPALTLPRRAQVGYPCLSLHGGKDQSDRESTISDFKSDVCNVLVATGVAARGLDVKELVLVVNFDPPNHHEEYVHRVGRTGASTRRSAAPPGALALCELRAAWGVASAFAPEARLGVALRRP